MITQLKKLFRRSAPRTAAQNPADWQRTLADLKRSVAALPVGDKLWPGLLALLDQYALDELDALAQPNISDGELRRSQGRIGMILDLKKNLAELPATAQAEQAAKSGSI